MSSNRHKYFRWTGRTARITFAYVVAFPAFVGYWAYVTDVSLSFRWDGGEGLWKMLYVDVDEREFRG